MRGVMRYVEMNISDWTKDDVKLLIHMTLPSYLCDISVTEYILGMKRVRRTISPCHRFLSWKHHFPKKQDTIKHVENETVSHPRLKVRKMMTLSS